MSITFDSGLRIVDRLIVDQEVAGSNPAPSIDCLAISLSSQSFLTTLIDSIDNKNFVAGFNPSPQWGSILTSFEHPAAAKLVTGNGRMESPTGSLSVIFTTFAELAAKWRSFNLTFNGMVHTSAEGLVHGQSAAVVSSWNCCARIPLGPAVSNHSNQPSAARLVARKGLSGELLFKEALCFIASRPVRRAKANASLATDHLGSFVPNAAGTVVSSTCRTSSSKTL